MGKLFKIYRNDPPVKKASGNVHAVMRDGAVPDKISLVIYDSYAEQSSAEFRGFQLLITFSEARKIIRKMQEFIELNTFEDEEPSS